MRLDLVVERGWQFIHLEDLRTGTNRTCVADYSIDTDILYRQAKESGKHGVLHTEEMNFVYNPYFHALYFEAGITLGLKFSLNGTGTVLRETSTVSFFSAHIDRAPQSQTHPQ